MRRIVMIEASVLDSLVRFAAAGASGVAIIAVVFVGYVISKTTPETHPEKYKLIKSYMWMSVVVAVISGVSGILNFSVNKENVDKAEEAVVELVSATSREEGNNRNLPTLPRAAELKLKRIDAKSAKTIREIVKRRAVVVPARD
jgi:hypothetical protein